MSEVLTGHATEPKVHGDLPLIHLKDLGKEYVTSSGNVKALANVDLDVQRGEFLSIVGPSGCGKTSILRILSGLIPHSSGVALLSGEKIGPGAGDTGVVFQKSVLLPWRTVEENVLLPIELRGKITQESRDEAARLLALVGLEEFAKKYPSELSGGMQQRAAICRALIHDPSVLLMDEPFGALDAMSRDNLNVELNKIWIATKKTVILITHSIPEAVFLSQRVVVMSARPGRILEIVDVPFAPMRDLELLGDAEFGDVCSHIRRFFKQAA